MSAGFPADVAADGANAARVLVDRLGAQLDRYGSSRRYTFVHEGADGLVRQERTFADLDAAARGVAVHLRERGAVGRPVLLAFPTGPEFLEAFLGCLYAGAVAVPLPLPADARSADRLASAAADSGACAVLTTSAHRDAVARAVPSGVTVQVTDVLAPAPGAPVTGGTPGTPALVQYTSGSTSRPRGVVVTPANLSANHDDIRSALGTGDDLVGVLWLPHFHDMGLVSLLHGLWVGGSCTALSPSVFLRRPARWLQEISDRRATMTVAPDFGYQLCLRAVPADRVGQLDLSSLRTALVGAEPVRPRTLAEFSERFGPAGFRPEAFAPCYGLAESTLLVTTSRPGTPPMVRPGPAGRGGLAEPGGTAGPGRTAEPGGTAEPGLVVGCGTPVSADVRIVDPATRLPVAPGQVGEIWISGPSVAAGYWDQPAATSAVFGAVTADGQGPFLRSGDLGCLLDGELVVVGRIKENIVVRGWNLSPQDIEQVAVGVHPAFRGAAGAAFGVQPAGGAGSEHVVVVQEARPTLLADPADVVADLRRTLADHFRIPAPAVVLVGRGVVPRTTSGKVQRLRTRELFLAGELAAIAESVPPSVAAVRGTR